VGGGAERERVSGRLPRWARRAKISGSWDHDLGQNQDSVALPTKPPRQIWTPDLYPVFSLRILFLLCTFLVLYESYESTILSCPLFYLFVSLNFLPTCTEILQGVSFISRIMTVPLAAPYLKENSLNRSRKPKVWYLSYPETFQKKTQGGGNKDHFLSRYTYPGFHCVPESSPKHIVSLCSAIVTLCICDKQAGVSLNNKHSCSDFGMNRVLIIVFMP